MLHEELTDRIIGAAIAVHRAIGPGLHERSYQTAMALELTSLGLTFESKRLIPVTYRGEIVGHHIPDFIVENAVVVELKSVTRIEPVFTTQLLTYLRLTGLHVGLILNFNVEALKFGVKRIVK
jgi:GxxExxY protein